MSGQAFFLTMSGISLSLAGCISGSNALLGFANVVWGSTGIYEVALGLVLLWPSSIFIRVLQDLSATD